MAENYTLAKLHKPKSGNDWYVYYTVKDPATGKMKLFKEREGINRIKNLKERRHEGILLAEGVNRKLKEGWTPFQKENKEKKIKDLNRHDFYWWFDEKIDYEKSRKDEGFYNWKNLTAVHKKLKSFSPVLLVEDYDYKFIKDFEKFLLDEGQSLNYIDFIMGKLKAITKIIMKSGVLPYHKNPFHNYKGKTTEVEGKRLTLEQVLKLLNVEAKNDSEDLARDMYVFAYFQAGMRWGDVCRTKKETFKTHNEYRMNKSKKKRTIKVMPEVQSIVDKYIHSEGEYLFNTKVDWSNPSKSIDDRNTFYNRKLKLMCERAEIPKISFHTARHSVADLAHEKDLDLKTIQGLLGHSKISTTERYMKRFYKEKTDDAMDKLFKK